jgi:hypothetical protein
MAYGDFTLKAIQEKFGIKNQVERIFTQFEPLQPSDWLKKTLEISAKLPNRSEKSKSETIVMPILLELRERNNDFFTVYSGENLNADIDNGLNGECDFILTKDTHTFDINVPIIQVVEAKKNDIDLGVPQCAAQMVGAKIFNERYGTPIEYIYGCVTTGNEWKFLKLNNDLTIDSRIYYLNELGELLAVFQTIIDYYKETLK